ncbi:MAG: lytic transglycosylase domain-containing protein [Gammaproteobacteria bacterium]
MTSKVTSQSWLTLKSSLIKSLLLVTLACSGLVQAAEVDPVLKERLMQAVALSDGFADEYDAEVWYTYMALRLEKRVPDPSERMEILRHVHHEARLANLPPELVLAVIDVESAFDRFAVSSAGARGLMQVMPFWLKELDRPDDNLFDIHTNLRMGCTILRYYMDREKDNYIPALARYNGSVGKSWYGERVLDRLSNRWFRH